MSLIIWKEEFRVGVAEVDFEHKDLIKLINSLHDSARPDAGRAGVIESLGEIYAQIASHFALEEKMMRASLYPSFLEHKQDHETLLDELRDIMEEVEDDGEYDEAQLSIDLERWFGDHFRTHDAKLHQERY